MRAKQVRPGSAESPHPSHYYSKPPTLLNVAQFLSIGGGGGLCWVVGWNEEGKKSGGVTTWFPKSVSSFRPTATTDGVSFLSRPFRAHLCRPGLSYHSPTHPPTFVNLLEAILWFTCTAAGVSRVVGGVPNFACAREGKPVLEPHWGCWRRCDRGERAEGRGEGQGQGRGKGEGKATTLYTVRIRHTSQQDGLLCQDLPTRHPPIRVYHCPGLVSHHTEVLLYTARQPPPTPLHGRRSRQTLRESWGEGRGTHRCCTHKACTGDVRDLHVS